jgi:hypothetical protein
MEVFKDIPNYEGLYQVSNLGNIKSLNYRRTGKSRILKLTENSCGYLKVCLSKNKSQKVITVHQLVSEAFLNHKPNGYTLVVDHIDNDKKNNNLKNLRVMSNRENCSKDRVGSSKYTGVYFHKARGKWMAKIQLNGKYIYLGSYINEEDAAEAYKNTLSLINKSN